MASRKKAIAPATDATPVEPKRSPTESPLVFISHDSRDADLAEAFGNLLTDASGGILKSFRSSDKKGTAGIEYGVEWYRQSCRNWTTQPTWLPSSQLAASTDHGFCTRRESPRGSSPPVIEFSESLSA